MGAVHRTKVIPRGCPDSVEVMPDVASPFARALNTARRALPEGPERAPIRHALDDLTDRHLPPAACHLPPADAERIAGAQLDSEIETGRAPEVTA